MRTTASRTHRHRQRRARACTAGGIYPQSRQVYLVQTPSRRVARHGSLGFSGTQDGSVLTDHGPGGCSGDEHTPDTLLEMCGVPPHHHHHHPPPPRRSLPQKSSRRWPWKSPVISYMPTARPRVRQPGEATGDRGSAHTHARRHARIHARRSGDWRGAMGTRTPRLTARLRASREWPARRLRS